MMRYLFVSHLVKELVGPREGAVEVMTASDEPRNEYSTGQLYPQNLIAERDPGAEEALAQGAEVGEEDGDDQPNQMNQAFLDAGQNFRRVPSSLGISFVLLTSPEKGDIRVCVTWARYVKATTGEWVRTPKYFITSFGGAENESTLNDDQSIRVTIKSSRVKNGSSKVSIFTQTCVLATSEGRPKNEEIVFQPEIRVKLKNADKLAELGDLSFASNDEEWRVSTRQYDKLKIFARGHLCGAYWKAIDPQAPYSPLPDNLEVPFLWVDGVHLGAQSGEINDFMHADLRTDFMPMYTAPAPDKIAYPEWSADLMRADLLAECSEISQMKKRLEPLLSSYSKWIVQQEIPGDTDATNLEILKRHREALTRMRDGIEFLIRNSDAHLAFLFMNKVMAKQYAWGKVGDDAIMHWRPFQLAFVLLSLQSTAEETEDRAVCDTIWFPTGGGKTEAYLGLAAFSLGYRRRSSEKESDGTATGDGTGVISRYTLRLLTIQQFRRALKMIQACEVLRCSSNHTGSTGWLPISAIKHSGMIWGRSPFSIGLWVGVAVTPNAMIGNPFLNVYGALDLLKTTAQRDLPEPAQILDCPCCATALTVPVEGLSKGLFKLKLHVFGAADVSDAALTSASTPKFKIIAGKYVVSKFRRGAYLNLDLELSDDCSPHQLLMWWRDNAHSLLKTRLVSFNVSRPGYLPIENKKGKPIGYEIRCPNADCELNSVESTEKEPSGEIDWDWKLAHPLFAKIGADEVAIGTQIHALTVDESMYARPVSMLISTVDKFVRTAFTNNAASIFGRLRSYQSEPGFSQDRAGRKAVEVTNFAPPSLIIQDELHLLDGPLGSAFGLFEASVATLCGNPKYIASSATIRNATEQIACLMGRRSSIFPAVNLDISNGFFLRSNEIHPLDESSPGRLFIGTAFPGRAPQTPMLRIWGRLLQTAQNIESEAHKITDDKQREARFELLDHYWTLIGYFNAVRELAQGEALMRQDIPQFLDKLHRQNPTTQKRQISAISGFKNLSSQTSSSELPGILAKMERTLTDGDALNAVASTSMFGTGVDVARLSLMVVHGQPKSASQYIQAVGRVGRRRSGLAVVFFRVSKPRDLNHYEYFTGYHRKLPIAVEPITVKPLSPKAIDRTLGVLITILIRNWKSTDIALPAGIDFDDGGALINQISPEAIAAIVAVFDQKWEQQPPRRQTRNKEDFLNMVRAEIQRWQEYARREVDEGRELPYTSRTANAVVLGESELKAAVFPDAPPSLREVEATIEIHTSGGR